MLKQRTKRGNKMSKRTEIVWYELVFEQLQPIHIGRLKYGVIAETEIFIPGQTMWGALTKYYNLYNKADLNENQNLFSLITCFFPSFDGEKVLAPSYKNGMLHIGDDIAEEEFRFAYTDTVISTAVSFLSREAVEGSLHEIDVLLPQPKNELPEKGICQKTNLKWVGLVGIEKNDENLNNFLHQHNFELHVGGEITYGFGLVVLKAIKKVDSQLLGDWNLNENGRLFLKDGDNILRNFIQINPDVEMKWKGNVMPIAEFDFCSNVSKIKEASFYVNVGSSIHIDEENDLNISEYQLSKGKFNRKNLFI